MSDYFFNFRSVFCNCRAARAAVHVNMTVPKKVHSFLYLTHTGGCLATFYGVWQAIKGKLIVCEVFQTLMSVRQCCKTETVQ